MCFLCSHKSNNDARMDTTKPILTITGSDSTGGSGIQADISTIAELGGNVVTAITCITVQTSLGIQEFFDIPAEIVSGQIDAVMNDFQPQIVKIGMIRREEVLTAIVEALERYRPRYVIYAPVIQSSRGEALMTDKAISKIRQQLLPLCTQVVVRQQDAELLQAVCDICLLNDATMHGIANSFSSALAVYLSEGETVEQAKAKAKAYVKAKTARASNLQGRASELYNEFLDIVGEHFHQSTESPREGGQEPGIVHYYANRLNVSPRYLAQVTKRISGKAPKTIIDECLIREIELQLNTTDRTVQEIAYSCGFSSQAHLTKFFKKQKGISPTAFKKNRQ